MNLYVLYIRKEIHYSLITQMRSQNTLENLKNHQKKVGEGDKVEDMNSRRKKQRERNEDDDGCALAERSHSFV